MTVRPKSAPVVELLEQRTLFAAPSDVLTKAIRQELLNHWTGSNKATLQADLNASKVTAFDNDLLSYMKGRSGQYFYWKSSDVAGIQDWINAHLDTSTTIDNANHIVNHQFPNGNSESYDVDLGSGDIDWSSTTSNPEFVHTLNRQEYWQDLSQAYIITGDTKYTTELISELSGWSLEFPGLSSPGATNNTPAYQPLGVAIRTNAWTWVYQQVVGSTAWTGGANTLFLYKLYQEAARLRAVTPYELTSNRSLFEAQALLQTAHLMPEFDAATDWKTYGRKLLFGAMDGQLNPDGGHAESSPGYAGSVILALLEMYDLDSKTGDGATWAGSRLTKLQNAAKAHVQLLTPDGKLAALSDTYRGVIGPFWDRPRLILNDTTDFPSAKPRMRDVWLFGVTGSNSLLGSAVNPPLPDRGKTYVMPQSGYYVMRSGSDSNARQLTFDAGPTGGFHGHLDLLNFELFGWGTPLISDPGLYNYDDSVQRAWAISTPAHNTISIDNQSHAAIEGVGNPDIQSSSINSVAGGYQITASHKGYKALAGSPLVTRSVWYDGNGVMLVVDWGEATGGASHTYTQSFLLPTSSTGSDLANGMIHSNGGSGRVLLQTLLQPGQQAHKQTRIGGTGSPNVFVSNDPSSSQIAKDATRYYVDQTGTSATFVTLVNAYNTENAPNVTAKVVGTVTPGGSFQVQIYRNGVAKELVTFYARPSADFRPAAPVAGANDIAWDSLGRLHMVYQDTNEMDLKYSVRGTDGKWSIPQTVDAGQFAGGWPSLAVDSNNNPVVAYFDGNGGDLKYASLVKGVWSIETIDSSGSTGLYPSLVLGAGDAPMIAYYRRTGGDLRLATHNSKGWKITTVDDAGDVGRCTSLALNPNNPGTAAIAYDDSNTGAKKFASVDSGGNWIIRTVDNSTPAGGGYTSLAYEPFTSSGKTYKPTLSYYDSSTTSLKFARFDGSAWNNEIVATQGVQGLYTSLYYDTNNQANILFFKKSTVRAYRVRGSFGSWTTSALGTGGREIQTAKRSNGTVAWTNLDSDGLRVGFL